MKHHDEIGPRRPLWEALFYEKSGDLNLSQIFLLLLGGTGTAGFIISVIINGKPDVFAWSWLGTFSMAILIAAVPLTKAKLIAKSKLMEEVNKGIVITPTDTSTDVSELIQKQKDNQ